MAGQPVRASASRGQTRAADRDRRASRPRAGYRRLSATARYGIADDRYAFDATGTGLAIVPFTRSAPDVRRPGRACGRAGSIDARFDLHLAGEGTLAEPDARGFIQFSQLAWGGYQVGATRIDAVVANGAARVTAAAPNLPGTVAAEVQLDAPHAYTAQASFLNARLRQLVEPTGPSGARSPDIEPAVALDTLAGALTAKVSASGQIDTVADSVVDLDLQLVDVAINGAPVRLARPARLRYENGQLIANDFELQLGATTLSASGDFGTRSSASNGLRAALKGSLADFLPLAHLVPALAEFDMAGTIDAEVRATGTLSAPEIAAEFSIDSASLASGTLPRVREMALHASFAHGLLDLRDVRGAWQGAQLTASGQIPVMLLGDQLPEAYEIRCRRCHPARARPCESTR